MEIISVFDEKLFFLINLKLTHPVLDRFMPWITDIKKFIIPVGILAVFYVFYGNKDKGRKAFFLCLLLIGLVISDKGSQLLKDIFQRARPCNVYEQIRLLVGCTSSFSMPSSHAVNITFISVALSYFFKRSAPLFILLALLVSYSRVYVGVHYPLDVIVGAVIGLFLAFGFISMIRSFPFFMPVNSFRSGKG